jgi:hypothetical protein
MRGTNRKITRYSDMTKTGINKLQKGICIRATALEECLAVFVSPYFYP